MTDATVRRRGTDTSGRGIYASDRLWAWWERVVATLGFTPTIVQGAWMSKNGGGAAASAGYHDRGGCLDLRTWNLTQSQQQRVIAVTRSLGAGSWIRDKQHGGMDPHIHLVLGSDHDLASGARWQWTEYVAGRNGLASRGADYHARPNPLVTTIPKQEDWLMATKKELRELLAAEREAIAQEVWKYTIPATDGAPAQKVLRQASNSLAVSKKVREIVRKRFNATDDQLDALMTEIAALDEEA